MKASTALRLGVSFAGMASLTFATASQAQTAPAADAATPTSIDDIVVTAQRREETIQTVPIAVSAFSASRREELGLQSAQDLVNFTPGASLSQIGLSIRGIGRLTTVLGSDAGVAIYTDGFYSADTTAIDQSTLFVDRVEILRGPQGTLYGRNSIGGSANLISRRPDADFNGEIRASVGNYGSSLIGGTVTGPITDVLRFRFGALKTDRKDGFIKNIGTGGGSLLDLDTAYVEAQLEWDVTPALQAWIKYSHLEADQSPSLTTSPILASQPFTSVFFPAASLIPAANYDNRARNPSAEDSRIVALDDPGRSALNGEHRVVGSLSWNLGAATLSYLGGYETSSTFAQGDYDNSDRSSYIVRVGGPDPLQPVVGTRISSRYLYTTGQDTEYFSHELTLRSDGDRYLNWIVGGNYYKEHLEQPYSLSAPDVAQLAQPIFANPPFASAAPNPNRDFYHQFGTLETESVGVFAQADYRLNDLFRVTAGARYTRDRKVGTENIRQVYWNPLASGLTSPVCCAFESTPASNFRSIKDTWDGVTARVALDWTPDDVTLGYASLSRGYKAGGFQLGQLAEVATVDPEYVTAYELGVKRTFGDLRVNAAIFYNDYQGFQVPITVLRGGGVAGAITQSQFVNADRARSYGAELEAQWRPTDAFQLIASYSYLDAQISKFCCVLDITQPTAGNQDLSGNDLPQSPRNKMSIGALYTLQSTFGRIVLAGTNSYVGAQYYSPFQLDRYRGASYNVANLTATLYDTDGRFELAGYVRNAFDKDYIFGLSLGPASVNSPRSIAPGDPRTYGLELRARF